MWSLAFFKGMLERAVKTFSQSLLAVIGVAAVGIHEIDWTGALSIAALAAVVSVLTSIGNADFVAGQRPVVIEHDKPVTVVNVAPAERTVDLTAPEEDRSV